MGMFSDICGLFKALNEYLGYLLDPYPEKKGPSIHKSDESSPWRADSYEPLSLLSEEDQKEAILRGDKSLEDFTMSHAWPPEKREEEETDKGEQEDASAEDVEQENEQEQGEDSENAESSEGSEISNESEQDTDSDGIEASNDSVQDESSEEIESASVEASDSLSDNDGFESDGSFESGFDSDSDGSGSSGSYDCYIG